MTFRDETMVEVLGEDEENDFELRPLLFYVTTANRYLEIFIRKYLENRINRIS